MTEDYKEQHPLLYEDFSDDERFIPSHHRRRPMTYKNRARYHVKGAAALFRRWPDHWSSFLTYLWIGIGMISLITFILYNSIFFFSLIPLTRSKPTEYVQATSPPINEFPKKQVKAEIFMHVFYYPDEEVDLNKYLPYIEDLSKNYSKFNYNLIIVTNDTLLSTEDKGLDAKEVNEMALNTLWSKDVTDHKIKKVKNINVQYITLSKYMNNSALIKFWRDLSYDVIEFLLRSLSIWDKGGIAFNPSILIPGPLKDAYSKKLLDILHKYESINLIKKINQTQTNVKNKFKKRVNNIRDVIDALEEEDYNNYTQQPLVEAENKEINLKMTKTRTRRSLEHNSSIHKAATKPLDVTDKAIVLPSMANEHQRNKIINDTLNFDNSHDQTLNISRTLNLLPSFLEYLFHSKNYNPHMEETPVLQLEVTTTNDINKMNSKVISTNTENELYTRHKVLVDKTNSEVTINDKSEAPFTRVSIFDKDNISSTYNKSRLTIDLKGNIIATETACHAFLGTLYSNAIHHPKPTTVTNLLISELSTYCKGLLSTCLGIDLILL